MDTGTSALREALEAALPERPFRIELWDGTSLPSADGGPTFSIRSPAALGHLLRAPGQLGVSRAYVTGALDIDSVDAALELLDEGALKPVVAESFAFDRAADAHRYIAERRNVGKVVLTP